MDSHAGARTAKCSAQVAQSCRQRSVAVAAQRKRSDRRHRRHAVEPFSEAATSVAAGGRLGGAAGTAEPLAAMPGPQLPFFPDRRCVEDIQLPPLAACHHYCNLTNGLEALPRLQQLGIQPRFLRLPSTRCEQQQFEALMNDLDADLLMRLALGQCCLVYDFGSRNKKRGAPRAVWYGLEFIRFALRRLWLGEQGQAYLRGYHVAHVFEGHVRNLSDGTKKKIRYYGRYIQPGSLPRLHLYGVYAATSNDGEKDMYAALLRHCEAHQASGGILGDGSSSGSKQALVAVGAAPAAAEAAAGAAAPAAAPAAAVGAAGAAAPPAAAPLSQTPELAAAASSSADLAEQQAQEQRRQQHVQAILHAAATPMQGLSPEQRHALLHGHDMHAAVEALLGMRVYLGGISHNDFHAWAERTGFQFGGAGGSKGSRVEL